MTTQGGQTRRTNDPGHPQPAGSHLTWPLLVPTCLAYLVLTVAVVTGSPLDAMDQHVAHMDLVRHWPDLHPWVSTFVIAGQRAPSAAIAAAWLAWRSWRTRTLRPLIVFGIAVLLLNLSVGTVKIATGRLGPQLTSHARAFFAGGDIFPSGHAANAVVVFGVLAWLATSHHRTATVSAALGAFSVGACTIFLDTHWVTDVIGGWLAGGLVLLVLAPLDQRIVTRLTPRASALLRKLGCFAAPTNPTPTAEHAPERQPRSR